MTRPRKGGPRFALLAGLAIAAGVVIWTVRPGGVVPEAPPPGLAAAPQVPPAAPAPTTADAVPPLERVLASGGAGLDHALDRGPPPTPGSSADPLTTGIPAPAFGTPQSETAPPVTFQMGGRGGQSQPTGPSPAPPAATSAAPPPAAALLPPAGGAAQLVLSVAAPAQVQGQVADARSRLAAGDAVSARQLLSRALLNPGTPEQDRAALRAELARLNEGLVFSPRVAAGDPFAAVVVVGKGEGLERISRANKVASHWRLIQRVNGLADPHRLKVGQTLKVVRGPFHAVVIKHAYRLDLYMGDPDKPAEWVYVRSVPVGLGEGDSTPVGDFVVRKGAKSENPPWTNPRTGERFPGGDPKNPIGTRWVGIEGVGGASQHTGYGLHGTIEPASIGQQRSMGCVRMLPADIELVYDVLGEGVSRVRIEP